MIHPQLRRHLPLALFALAFAVGGTTGFAQEPEAAPPAEHSVLDMIMDGGPLIMAIWVAIIATSVTMVTFIIQNIMSLRKDKLAPPPLITALQQNLAAGNYQEAWETCNANNNYMANVLKA